MPGRQRLTVVQLLPALGSGGVERSTLEISQALAAAGHRAVVVSAGGHLTVDKQGSLPRGWRVEAHNPRSGAHGIPQALPGNKMATAGSDWQTNPRTQISWGLAYIESRYGTPCGAWNAFLSKGWY